MYCSRCGTQNENASKFCRSCGMDLSATTPVSAARGNLAPPEIRQVLAQVARALAYAHRSGIVHRDIKPDNIMFDEHGLAMVTDFGIAKAATGGKLTGTGMSIGTPHYMSPEQARAQALDGRSDLYSLGVVAYQCLTGGVPFDGEDSFAIGYKHIMEELPTPSLETPDKRSLFEIIRKMMAKLPDDRFQNADDLVQALEGGAFAPLAFATAPTRAIPSLSKLPAAPTTPPPPPAPGTPARLTLQGVPPGARVTLNGQPVRGPQLDVPAGVYKLAVRAGGYQPYERQVVVPPGAPLTVRVELQAAVEAAQSGVGPCDAYGPAYNHDKICFDTRPIPLQPALVRVPGDAPVFPRPAILLFHVSRSGETQEVRAFARSNVETFNDQALDLAKNLRWNPALKNGQPLDACVH